jgi:aminoglycoside phosphotransferase
MSKRGGAAISREKNCGAVDVPACLSGAVAGYAWARNTIGESGGAVYRLHGKPGAPELYLKHGKHRVADDFGAEAARLRWLAEYLLRRLHAISPAACPLQERFMRSYGIADIDQGKLSLHLLLDELF